jgi:CheY-like chemotaxis protein
LAAGFDDHLTKPLDFAVLQTFLARAQEQRRTQIPSA